ncbi:unnamed protein product [Allacma fusca]|uniref:Uncharacterized protein n=1 Tax=Allacma fusca TaxID=39272 RepID=A0A8J2LSX9_9HEXA|nr:unnamed protein product [Allacma fusca]
MKTEDSYEESIYPHLYSTLIAFPRTKRFPVYLANGNAEIDDFIDEVNEILKVSDPKSGSGRRSFWTSGVLHGRQCFNLGGGLENNYGRCSEKAVVDAVTKLLTFGLEHALTVDVESMGSGLYWFPEIYLPTINLTQVPRSVRE